MNIGTKIESLIKGFWNNTQAVSPVVASLVLVVVAITGAAGVGMIQGNLASDVSDEASTEGIIASSGTELLIAGSTTVQPLAESLGEAFMIANPGVKVTVQPGGSGVGIASTGMDIVDIGMASEDLGDAAEAKYPHIMTHQIGSSAVVVIMNGIDGNFTNKSELIKVFSDLDGKVSLDLNATTGEITCNQSNNTFTVYQRAQKSGTEDTFKAYLGIKIDDSGATTATGNGGMLTAVEGTTNSIGFVDFGFANENVYIAGIESVANSSITSDSIKAELSGTGNTEYIADLTRPLNFLTLGEPSSTEGAFIDFALLYSSKQHFEDCGYYSMVDLAKAQIA